MMICKFRYDIHKLLSPLHKLLKLDLQCFKFFYQCVRLKSIKGVSVYMYFHVSLLSSLQRETIPWLTICFPGWWIPSRKGSVLKEKNLLLEEGKKENCKYFLVKVYPFTSRTIWSNTQPCTKTGWFLALGSANYIIISRSSLL